MLAEDLEWLARGAPGRAAAICRRFGELDHRCIHPRFEHLRGRLEPGIFAVMRQVRPVAADRRSDRIAGLGMIADRARQLEELERPFEIEIDILGNRGACRLLALAELEVRPEPPRLALDVEP